MEITMMTTRPCAIILRIHQLTVHTKGIITIVTTKSIANLIVIIRKPMTKMMRMKKIVTIKHIVRAIVSTKGITTKPVTIKHT